MTSIVVAYGNNKAIGLDGDLPWKGELPSDLAHFRSLTLGHSVIMGRTTFESIGWPLKKRRNIVLSSQRDLNFPDCEVVHSLDEAFSLVEDEDEIFIIGGSKVYIAAMPAVDKLCVTEIYADFEGDSYFPVLDERQWREISRQSCRADEANAYDYDFVEYERIT